MIDAQLPVILKPENSDLAVALLRDYFAPPDGRGSDFRGAQFERLGRPWNDHRYANRITASDIVAVNCLSVDVPGDVSIALLGADTAPVEALLEKIPADLDLWDATDEQVGPHSPARELWTYLRRPGLGQMTTSKLMARKRARLVPVYDAVIAGELGLKNPGAHWEIMRKLLNTDVGGGVKLHDHLKALGERAGLDTELVTPLRVFDVATWYFGNPKLAKRVAWVAQDHGTTVPNRPPFTAPPPADY
ncbi:MAG: DUF6308 family protein [Cellulomonadaceae bacterium]|nr:DUF6308 family protein [Cellulomonadaceae bacterium]